MTALTWRTVWDAYDVPRLWDAVSGEDDPLGWEQVHGLQRMAEALHGHADDLRARRELLARAWQGSTADRTLSRWDTLIATVAHEASGLTGTACGLHGIMTTLACAKQKIEPLLRQWNAITSDWIPDFWDEVAAELNEEARTIMLVAAAEIRDYRGRIPYPATHPSPSSPPPAVPGHQPATSDGEQLAGMPMPVAAAPGQPVSMLPIPPGNPYAPHGGAYLLPGPGVGNRGFIVPMAGAVAAQPKPRSRSRWTVPTGVPSLIQPVGAAPGEPTPEDEAAFGHWFADLATPWRQA